MTQNEREIFIGDKEARHQKIQLWSNVFESEYALRLAIAAADNSEELFLAKTDPDARYTHIVAESDYLEDFKEGWEYTLRHFIEETKKPCNNSQKKNI